jgi:hypothetical protein
MKIRFGNGIFGLILTVVLSIYGIGTWIVNAVQFVSCDFSTETSWKGETLHGVGLVPPFNCITAWFSDK